MIKYRCYSGTELMLEKTSAEKCTRNYSKGEFDKG